MSKSNKKQPDRLRDSCRREKLKGERHHVKQLLKEHRFEEAELEVDLFNEEEESK